MISARLVHSIPYRFTNQINCFLGTTELKPHGRDSVQSVDFVLHLDQMHSDTAKGRSGSATRAAAAADGDTQAMGWYQLGPSMKSSGETPSLHTACYAQRSGGMNLAK